MAIQTKYFLLALAATRQAISHTGFAELFVNGVGQGDGTCVRMKNDPGTVTSPIAGIGSNDMACNANGATGVARVCQVPDGATLSFEFRSWMDDYTRGVIDPGHKGPCAVYLKKVDSAIDDKGAGDGWFKIAADGYDEGAGKWCTDKVIEKGHLDVALPQGLEGGYYLVRPELLALHFAHRGEPQFYTGCAQIFLKSSGNKKPKSTVSIPGYVQSGDKSLTFDIYDSPLKLPYSLPGPDVASFTGSSKREVGTIDRRAVQKTQTEGLKPEGCILENANWCGVEVPSYSDEKSCWSSSKECWAQSKKCFDSAPPTGSANCKIWEKKCEAINSACNSRNFDGPPNKDKVLTPVARRVKANGVRAASPLRLTV
ncbi:hypothetical protein P152DRAFT_408077 [Eremomyces bilateralis CBS 781.70]|uniref:AA9 family lytic polysaccharide monooxygenase n=1 Tax=Eremomyces bilateralis CBS 781.70 TaxID=1392243 RepID=A0A6G1GHU7_9PEZI|nr:uncharacterized protein P152DRAFT_408077 [Eremomyces bilateralis CBS 781.70]KAF1817449.1 hypothetical protein P152DRAFT_408077 [Eremomyces bilateralis CBS 781.70]